jgi:tetratricopeptide (TPR) repeat protein
MKLVGQIMLVFVLGLSQSCASKSESGKWIREAQAANSSADQAIAQGNIVAARTSLRHVLAKPAPTSIPEQDVIIVKQDIYFRLAALELQAGKPKAALIWSEQGLSLSQKHDLFTANLLVAKGNALEALGNEVDAVAEFHKALKINEKLLNQALDDGSEKL